MTDKVGGMAAALQQELAALQANAREIRPDLTEAEAEKLVEPLMSLFLALSLARQAVQAARDTVFQIKTDRALEG